MSEHNSIESLQETFREQDFALPHFIQAFEGRLIQPNPNTLFWTTRPGEVELPNIDTLINDLSNEGAYLAIGFSGSEGSLASNRLHCCLKRGDLILYIEETFGPVLGGTTRTRINGNLNAIDILANSVTEAKEGNYFPNGQKLIAIQNPGQFEAWCWASPNTPIGDNDWQWTEAPIMSATLAIPTPTT